MREGESGLKHGSETLPSRIRSRHHATAGEKETLLLRNSHRRLSSGSPIRRLEAGNAGHFRCASHSWAIASDLAPDLYWSVIRVH